MSAIGISNTYMFPFPQKVQQGWQYRTQMLIIRAPLVAQTIKAYIIQVSRYYQNACLYKTNKYITLDVLSQYIRVEFEKSMF